ncbi:MAG: DUF370 domain-containing protein [Clostridiales bacterium]|nr:DUF370 domain-containing protein [Clostridiales bacterium]
MYLHAGNGRLIRKESIVGIFDLDATTKSQVTRAFLSERQKESGIVTITSELPVSFILTFDGMTHLSQLSTTALAGRAEAPIPSGAESS